MYGEGSGPIITAATGNTKDWEQDIRLEVEEKEYKQESIGKELEADSGEE